MHTPKTCVRLAFFSEKTAPPPAPSDTVGGATGSHDFLFLETQRIYINQIRNPVDRFVSEALFLQFCICHPPEKGGRWCKQRRELMREDGTNSSFCALELNDLATWMLANAKHRASINGINMYIAFFCGLGPFAPLACKDTNSPEALQLASHHLMHNYACTYSTLSFPSALRGGGGGGGVREPIAKTCPQTAITK
jgi:hypothetical protein